MKSALLFGTTVVLFGLISCGKKNIQPVISLNGEMEQTLALGTPYSEEGATAQDNKDGDISDDIIITGTVNHNLVGEYRIFYNVEDSEGNKAATATRFINVVNDADFMIGTYEASPTCMGTVTYDNYNTVIWTSNEVNNQILIRRVLWGVEDEPVVANVSGSTITIPTQTIGDVTMSGTATYISGNFLLDVTITGPWSYDCSIDHVKL